MYNELYNLLGQLLTFCDFEYNDHKLKITTEFYINTEEISNSINALKEEIEQTNDDNYAIKLNYIINNLQTLLNKISE